MSELKSKIQAAMTAAMRAQEKERLGAIRLIWADLRRVEVDERIELDDARILAVLDKMQKQRRESIAQFSAANRADLVEKEQKELVVIQEFLPQALSEAEIRAAIAIAIDSVQAKTIKEMGKVMGLLKPQLQGKADLTVVSEWVKAQLAS